MHLLEGLNGEVSAFESTKCYLRKQGIVVTKDTNKSVALGTFQNKTKNGQKLSLFLAFKPQIRIKLCYDEIHIRGRSQTTWTNF